MFLDNAKFAVKETISSTATTGGTFKITPKFKDNPNEAEVLLATAGQEVSIKLQNGTSIERMTVTIVANTGYSTCTIVKRWLKYDGSETEEASLKCQWTDGTIWLITAFTADLIDKNWPNTIAGDMTFSWDVVVNWTFTDPVYADATARDLAIIAPVNWMSVYLTAEWYFTDYAGWAWVTRANWATPNADSTTAWKVEIAIDSEITSGTNTGWTWAFIVPTPSQIKKSISLKTAGTTFWDTDEIAVNISWEDKRITWANLRESIPASTTQKGTVELATDAEVITWTDTTRYVNVKQITDLKFNIWFTASNTLQASADTERSEANTVAYQLKKAITLWYYPLWWTIRVKFDLKTSNWSNFARGKVYKNWSPIWTERTNNTTNYITYSEDFTITGTNDSIQLYAYQDSWSWSVAMVRNFRIYYDLTQPTKFITVTQD